MILTGADRIVWLRERFAGRGPGGVVVACYNAVHDLKSTRSLIGNDFKQWGNRRRGKTIYKNMTRTLEFGKVSIKPIMALLMLGTTYA